MSVLEDILQELTDEKAAMEKQVLQMPNTDSSRIRGYYEERVKAYGLMIEFVEKYQARNHKKEKERGS